MKPAKPKQTSTRVPLKREPNWDNSPEDDLLLDSDTLQRKAAHEACKEVDLPDFIDQHDFD